jgi:hypothetical protein
MDEKEVINMLRKILNFRKEIRQKGNSDYDRVSNKDILLHILVKLDRMEERVSITEAKQKMMMWFVPIILALIGISKIF